MIFLSTLLTIGKSSLQKKKKKRFLNFVFILKNIYYYSSVATSILDNWRKISSTFVESKKISILFRSLKTWLFLP